MNKLLFDCETCVQYRGTDLETFLLASYIAVNIPTNSRVVFDTNPNLVETTQLNLSQVELKLAENPCLLINVGDLSRDTGWIKNLKFALQDFKFFPWKCSEHTDTTVLLAVMGGARSASLFNTSWEIIYQELKTSTGCGEIETFGGTLPAWQYLQENMPKRVVTDSCEVARLAAACECDVVYLGGPDPKSKWWPVMTTNRLTWISQRDASPNLMFIRCPCNSPKECHSQTGDELPCVMAFGEVRNMGEVRRQLRNWVKSVSRGTSFVGRNLRV